MIENQPTRQSTSDWQGQDSWTVFDWPGQLIVGSPHGQDFIIDWDRYGDNGIRGQWTNWVWHGTGAGAGGGLTVGGRRRYSVDWRLLRKLEAERAKNQRAARLLEAARREAALLAWQKAMRELAEEEARQWAAFTVLLSEL